MERFYKLKKLKAKEMEDSQQSIVIRPSSTQAFRSCCGWSSVRQLKPGHWFGGDLINTILGLLANADGLQSVYLGTDIYLELKKTGFGETKKWLQGITRDGQWIFAVCEDRHWVAVRIDWRRASIQYYDPQTPNRLAESRENTITAVRSSLKPSLWEKADLVY